MQSIFVKGLVINYCVLTISRKELQLGKPHLGPFLLSIISKLRYLTWNGNAEMHFNLSRLMQNDNPLIL